MLVGTASICYMLFLVADKDGGHVLADDPGACTTYKEQHCVQGACCKWFLSGLSILSNQCRPLLGETADVGDVL